MVNHLPSSTFRNMLCVRAISMPYDFKPILKFLKIYQHVMPSPAVLMRLNQRLSYILISQINPLLQVSISCSHNGCQSFLYILHTFPESHLKFKWMGLKSPHCGSKKNVSFFFLLFFLTFHLYNNM